MAEIITNDGQIAIQRREFDYNNQEQSGNPQIPQTIWSDEDPNKIIKPFRLA